jgi:DNA polymerase III subunit beta
MFVVPRRSLHDRAGVVKLVAKANALAVATKAAAGAIDDKTAKRSPILGALLIDATGPDVKFTGTDLDSAITASCAASITKASAAASAEALTKLFAGIPTDAEVPIETTDSRLQIKTGRSRYQLPALPPEDFPQAPVTTSTAEMVLSRNEVQHLLGATAFCANTEGTRYYLQGAFLHLNDDGHLCAVATDGHRLALATGAIVPAPGALPVNGKSVGVIVPNKTIASINKIKTEQIELRTDAKVIEIRAGNLSIVSKLIDGIFPDYPKIIPAKSDNIAKLEREALLAALRLRVARDAAEQNINMGLAWKKGDDAVRMAIGVIGEDTVAASTAGAAQITLSIARMLTMAEEIEAEQLQLGVSSKSDPIRITAGSLLAVLAPCTR